MKTFSFCKKINLSVLFIWGASACMAASPVSFASLTTEMRRNPDGIGTASPCFSWKLTAEKHGVMQAAYRIETAYSEKELQRGKNLIWDTGRIDSDKSVHVKYGGTPLVSGKRYFWRVTVWTDSGEACISDIQHLSTGLIGEPDWTARWIGIDDTARVENYRTILPARYLRKEFEVLARPRRAMLYVSGVGSSTCHINGKRVGKDVFGPIPTFYDVSVSYLTYDVTDLINKGMNTLGVELGNGRFLSMRSRSTIGFGVPRLTAELHLEYGNNRTEVVYSDQTWKATNMGPIKANNEYDGEIYDARMELGKWTQSGYDDSAWRNADSMEPPKGRLTAQLSPSVRVMEELAPVSIVTVGEKRYIVDMGQNMVGWLHVKLEGKEGVPVTMRFAETLGAGGMELYLDNMRSAQVMDTFIPASDGAFSWEPAFVYHGFRYVEISGADDEPSTEDLTGKVIHDYMETIGSFNCSNELLNRLYRNAFWGIRSNYQGIPIDCPQRDEREGWLGDRSTGACGESFIFDNALLYKKWLVDIEESMRQDGCIAVISPRFRNSYHDNITWPSAFFNVAEMIYRQFGDDSSIKRHYPAMKRWVEYTIRTQMSDHIMTKDRYGDWCVPPESSELIFTNDPARKTAAEVLSTTVFYSILKQMQEFAAISGCPQDAVQYARLAGRIKETYNAKYFDRETARYDNNTVTANLLSLRLGLVPEGYEESVFAGIVEKIETDHDGHVATGVVGIQHLMRGLTEHGGVELAYRIATNETYPSWGYMIRNDATTIWELWNGDTADPAMNSHNHVMLLGDLLIWYYENLAGIKNDPSSAGFKKIWMEPCFPEGLTFVDASYESPYGTIGSCWKRDGDRLTWDIAVPVNSTATVKLPAIFNATPVIGSDGVISIAQTDDSTTIELGSGTYTIGSKH